MVLELLGRVLLAEGRDLVEVHLEVVRHLLREGVLRRGILADLEESDLAFFVLTFFSNFWPIFGKLSEARSRLY